MTMLLPPIDLHAHVDASIAVEEMEALNAVVFCVTRSLDEAADALLRSDELAVWGTGCHPGLASAHKGFSSERFAELVQSTCFVGEVGLDGGRANTDRQRTTLQAVLEVLRDQPRITSLHSAGATGPVLAELSRTPVKGAVLHWWLGDASETAQAVELGCYFSLNHAGITRNGILRSVPLNRLLTETDHPFGDKRSKPQRPGNTGHVEDVIARHHGLTATECRRQLWVNLASLVQETRCGRLVPRGLARRLATVPTNG
jgi:TatD DNase family protein